MYITDIFGSDVFVWSSEKYNNLDLQQPVSVTFASLSSKNSNVEAPDIVHIMVWQCYNLILKRSQGVQYNVRYLDWVNPTGSKPAVPSDSMAEVLQQCLDTLGFQVVGIDPDVSFMTVDEKSGSWILGPYHRPDVVTSVHFYRVEKGADLKLAQVFKDINTGRGPGVTDLALHTGTPVTPTKLVQVIEDERLPYHTARSKALKYLHSKGWALPILKTKLFQGRSYLMQDAHPHVRPLSELIRPRVWKSLPDRVANSCCRSLLDLSVFFANDPQMEYIPCGLDDFMHDLVVDTSTGGVYLWNLTRVAFTVDGVRYPFGFNTSASPQLTKPENRSALDSNVRQTMTELLRNNHARI